MTKFAIVRDGSHQIRVEEGAQVLLDLRDAEPGSKLELDEVLLLSTGKKPKVGNPTVKGAKVACEVIGTVKGEKIYVTHFRRRKSSKDRKGHRQRYTQVRVEKISATESKKKETTEKAVEEKATAEKAPKKATAKKTVKKATAKKTVKKATAKKTVKKATTKKTVKKED